MPIQQNKKQTNFLLLIAVIFLLSRVVFYWLGIRYDAGLLRDAWHLIDIDLLKNNLWESIWYMHGQPPLYNIYNGLVLKLFPTHYISVFHFIHIIAGLVTSILLFKIFTEVGINRKISFAATVYYFLTPTCILYENWHFYTYFEILLLTASAWYFIRFLGHQNLKYGALLFTCMALLVLTRSMFHLVWFAFIAIGLVLIFWQQRFIILKASIIPLACIIFWYGKNYYLYHKFTASTWLGMNFARIAEPKQNIGAIEPFSALSLYQPYIKKETRFNNIEVLQAEIKPNSKLRKNKDNYNNINYIHISDLYLAASLAEVKQNPLRYLKNVFRSQILYFDPPTIHWEVGKNIGHIPLYTIIFDGRLLNIVFRHITGKNLYNASVFILIMHVFVLLAGLVFLYNTIVKNALPANKRKFWAFCFLVFNVVYVMLIGNLLEYGENYRFKVSTAPFFLALVICSAQYLYQQSALLRLKNRQKPII